MALGPAASGLAMDDATAVQAGFAAFGPARTEVLAGDSVVWRNVSVRTHTVTAADGGWYGRLTLGATFRHRFDAPGTYAYYCTLHPFMRGEVDVDRLLLSAPAEPAAPGRPYVLAGRAALPAGSRVTIEADYGAGRQPAATATVGDDGGFHARLTPRASATLRAVAGADASPPVRLLVVDRKLAVRVRHRGRGWTVTARVTPASPGAKVVLELRLRDRFGWWPQQTGRLDRGSTVRFRLRPHGRVRARVALTLGDGATVVALSRVLTVGR